MVCAYSSLRTVLQHGLGGNGGSLWGSLGNDMHNLCKACPHLDMFTFVLEQLDMHGILQAVLPDMI